MARVAGKTSGGRWWWWQDNAEWTSCLLPVRSEMAEMVILFDACFTAIFFLNKSLCLRLQISQALNVKVTEATGTAGSGVWEEMLRLPQGGLTGRSLPEATREQGRDRGGTRLLQPAPRCGEVPRLSLQPWRR